MVSLRASKAQTVFGQQVVDQKSNEITTVPELLDIEGAIVTSDAMSCQKESLGELERKTRIM